MGMRSFVGFGFVLALAVWACNSSSDDPSGGTGGTTGQVELEDGTVGSSCADSCQDGLQCAASASIPNGYCTATCTADDQCGAEGRCAQTKSGALCFRGCSDDNGCRPGYACVDAGGYSVCDVGTPAQGTGGSAQGTGGSTQTGDCNTVALPAEVSGGCNIRLVTPQNCEEIDLSGGRTYEFAWTTDTTMCETPFVLYILRQPADPAERRVLAVLRRLRERARGQEYRRTHQGQRSGPRGTLLGQWHLPLGRRGVVRLTPRHPDLPRPQVASHSLLRHGIAYPNNCSTV